MIASISEHLFAPVSWHVVVGALSIFALRLIDMTLDTFRVISIARGWRKRAALFGFCEAAIFISAITIVLHPPLHVVDIIGYAAGFALGNFIGMSISYRLISDHQLVRLISRESPPELLDHLRAEGFAVTRLEGRGKDGPVLILMSVVRTGNLQRFIEAARSIEPKAFIVTEPVSQAVGGHIVKPPSHLLSVRK